MNKTIKVVLIIIGAVVAIATILVLYVKIALPNVGAAQEIKIEANPTLLERGAYLANHVSVCMDCHSTRDWSKFSGPLIPGTRGAGGDKFGKEIGFPGEVYAKNITPAALANWTDGEIYRAITTGVSKNGDALFPLMPYHSYGKMDDFDVKAIIAYLRTLTPIENEFPERKLDFPLNIIVNTMPKAAQPITKPDPSEVLAYGKYLTTISGCGDCHSTQGSEKAFAGGMEFKLPNGVLRAVNITPHASGIGEWSKEAFVKKFKTYADSSYLTNNIDKDAFNTVMPWTMYAGMTEQDLSAIYAYLQTIEPVDQKIERFTAAK